MQSLGVRHINTFSEMLSRKSIKALPTPNLRNSDNDLKVMHNIRVIKMRLKNKGHKKTRERATERERVRKTETERDRDT